MSASVHAVLLSGRKDLNGSLGVSGWGEGALLTFTGVDGKMVHLRIPEPQDVRALAQALLAQAGPVADEAILETAADEARKCRNTADYVRDLRARGIPAVDAPAGSPDEVLCGLEDGRLVAFTDCLTIHGHGLEILPNPLKEEPPSSDK